jgi:hypothetical protein
LSDPGRVEHGRRHADVGWAEIDASITGLLENIDVHARTKSMNVAMAITAILKKCSRTASSGMPLDFSV